ncbi:hypothetical protein ACF1FX_26810 [Streptomyces sp. NPDC014646]|uniref:hypothetical protein n=1 Tax=Streptomyces sp. NPDC014646 TaxID=3364877 RepID=UPI0037004461
MNPRHLLFLLLAAVVAGVLGVGAALAWPVWIWFLLPALVAGVLLLGTMTPSTPDTPSTPSPAERAFPMGPEPDEDTAPLPPVEPPYLVADVLSVPVESAEADYPFLFSAMVRWRTTPEYIPASHGNPAGLAVATVLQRVRGVVAAEQPSRCEYLQHWLEGALGSPVTDDAGLVSAFATDVRLTLNHTDQQHLDALHEQRKSESTWESRREHERNQRAYLGRDVLRSPGSAVVWWMTRHEDQIERAVEMIAPLTCLSAAANDREIPKEFRHLFTTSEDPVMSEDPVRDPSTGGFDHPEPVGDEAAPEEESFETIRPQQATFGDLVSAILDEVGLEPYGAEWTAFLLRLASMCEKAGGKDAADRIRQDLLRTGDGARYDTRGDTEGERSHAGAEEGAPATGVPTAGPVPRARAEDAATAHANGYDGAGPEKAERAERVESGWWDGPQARTAPGAEPLAPPAPDPQPPAPPASGLQPPTYTGPETAHRNGLDEEERDDEETWQ